MDELTISSITLKNLVESEPNPAKQEALVLNYLTELKTEERTTEFPTGTQWFNVSEPLSLSKHLSNTVTVLDFFTYCCINCMHILPHLKSLEENNSNGDGLIIVGVHSPKFTNEKDSSNLQSAIKRYEITHPVINDDKNVMWNQLNISCWPTLVILGPNAKPLFVLVGEGHKDVLFLYVKCALKYYKSSIKETLLPIDLNSQSSVVSNVLSYPGKITCVGAEGKELFAVSDTGNNRILIVTSDGKVKFTVGGPSSGLQDGDFVTCRFNKPQGVAFDGADFLYVADTENHAVRKVNFNTQRVTTLVGNGEQGFDPIGGRQGSEQLISSPWDLVVVEYPNFSVSKPMFAFPIGSPPPSSIMNVGGPPRPPPPPIMSLEGPPLPPPPPIMNVGGPPPPIMNVGGPPPPIMNVGGPLPPQQQSSPSSNRNSTTKMLLISMAGTHQIWALFLKDAVWWKGRKYKAGVCVPLAGSGLEGNRNSSYPMTAELAQPSGLAVSLQHDAVFIADSESSSVRKMLLKDGKISSVVGGDKDPTNLFSYGDIDGVGTSAKLQHPLAVCCDRNQHNTLYVIDSYNHKVKTVDLSTLSCKTLNLEAKCLNEPGGACTDSSGLHLYIADTNNNCVQIVSLKDGHVTKFQVMVDEVEKVVINEWVVNCQVSPLGGTVNVTFNLQPLDLHGQWKLRNVYDTQYTSRGMIESGNLNISIQVPQLADITKPSQDCFINFKFSFCTDDVCLFKEHLLRVHVDYDNNAGQSIDVKINKDVR